MLCSPAFRVNVLGKFGIASHANRNFHRVIVCNARHAFYRVASEGFQPGSHFF